MIFQSFYSGLRHTRSCINMSSERYSSEVVKTSPRTSVSFTAGHGFIEWSKICRMSTPSVILHHKLQTPNIRDTVKNYWIQLWKAAAADAPAIVFSAKYGLALSIVCVWQSWQGWLNTDEKLIVSPRPLAAGQCKVAVTIALAMWHKG